MKINGLFDTFATSYEVMKEQFVLDAFNIEMDFERCDDMTVGVKDGKGYIRCAEVNHFNRLLGLLRENMTLVNGAEYEAVATEKCENFDKFEYKHLELEGEYNNAYENASDASYELIALIFELSKNAAKDLVYRVNTISKRAKASIQTYVVSEKAERITALADSIVVRAKNFKKNGGADELIAELSEIKEILDEALAFTAPNFFAMGYYLTYANQPLPEMDVEELNVYLRKYLDDDFMLGFIEDVKRAIQYSASKSYKEKAEALSALAEYRKVYESEQYDKKACYET